MLAASALLVMLATSAGGAERVPGFATPDPGMIEQIRRRHHPGQSLRVTSGAERWSLRAHDLDERGLHDITPVRGTSPPSDPLPWSRIERIDHVTDRRTYGRITGVILGGLAGLILPAVPDGYSTDPPAPVGKWALGGALVGALAGDMLGRHNVREHRLYVAPLAPLPRREPAIALKDTSTSAGEPVATASPDSTRATTPAITAPETAVVPPATPSRASSFATDPAVARALRRFDSGSLLRINSASGLFHGYASRADFEGLHELRPEPSLPSVGGIRSLTWSEIQRIEKRGGSAGSGAVRGAVIVGVPVGLLSGLLTMAVLSAGGGDPGPLEGIGGGLVGLGIGGAVGAGIGAAIGSGVSGWHPVYPGH